MAEIRVLPEGLRNRIAAGEVIERPASVLKELAENALDAHAGRIEIEVAGGGQGLVRVTDDGEGIAAAQLERAVLRHATSKIRSLEDIYSIHTLGFRGEALPSIAAVSRFEIISRPAGEAEACRLTVAGGAVGECRPCSHAPGTVVAVRDLFYNTPVRRKFLKSARSEVAAMRATVQGLALGHPESQVRFVNEGKVVLDLPVHGDALSRIAALLDSEEVDALVPLQYEGAEGLVVSGFVARPPVARANRRGIEIFLNRRAIECPGVVQAVRQAAEGYLAPRRYPLAFVFLGIEPGGVDVNVHPAKREVRFSNERLVTGAVHRAVTMALRGHAQMGGGGPVGRQTEPGGAAPRPPGPRAAVETPVLEAGESTPPGYCGPTSRPEAARGAGEEPVSGPARNGPGGPSPVGGQGVLLPAQGERPERLRLLGQLHESYLVLEVEEGLMLIDQHAAHERLLYESLGATVSDIESQALLVPAVVELAPEEAAVYAEVGAELAGLGFRIEPFGERTLAVQGVPAAVPGTRAGMVLRTALADLAEGGQVRDPREQLRRRLACRAAVKAGEHLPLESLVSLVLDLRRRGVALTCPHGRPFVFVLSRDELARRFERS